MSGSAKCGWPLEDKGLYSANKNVQESGEQHRRQRRSKDEVGSHYSQSAKSQQHEIQRGYDECYSPVGVAGDHGSLISVAAVRVPPHTAAKASCQRDRCIYEERAP